MGTNEREHHEPLRLRPELRRDIEAKTSKIVITVRMNKKMRGDLQWLYDRNRNLNAGKLVLPGDKKDLATPISAARL